MMQKEFCDEIRKGGCSGLLNVCLFCGSTNREGFLEERKTPGTVATRNGIGLTDWKHEQKGNWIGVEYLFCRKERERVTQRTI